MWAPPAAPVSRRAFRRHPWPLCTSPPDSGTLQRSERHRGRRGRDRGSSSAARLAGPALPLRPPYERAPARLSTQGTFPSLISALTALASPAPRPGPRAGQSRARSNPGAAPPPPLAIRGGRCREGARPTREGLGGHHARPSPRDSVPPPVPRTCRSGVRGMGTRYAGESCRPLCPGAPSGAQKEPGSEPQGTGKCG